MDFGQEIRDLAERISSAQTELVALKERYEKAAEVTNTVLRECKDAGIKSVAIGMSDKSVPSSTDYPFSPNGSIFAMGNSKDGWPKIWGVVERAGIGGGCGNANQHQIDSSKVVDGVYHFSKGVWEKVR